MSRRTRQASVLASAGALAAVLVGGAVYAGAGPPDAGHRVGNGLVQDQEARNAGQQVLGGSRDPGVPSVQRVRHDDVTFTVTVAPARPGPNLVRVDATKVRSGATHHRTGRVLVGTADDPDGELVAATPRPGTDGLWAVVDLPPGAGTVLVSHGRWHRVPFAVETGGVPDDAAEAADWSGPDGPECLTTATAALLAGGETPKACPSTAMTATDVDALRTTVDTLATRGVTELALVTDDSARSRAAYDLVSGLAADRDVELVGADVPPGERNALLVLSGWAGAAEHLASVSSTPLRQQPIRSDGTWLAPWLLSPGVVDSTAGAMLALDFDIREQAAQQFGDALATYLPGQAPTASAYAAWRDARGVDPDPVRLFAASRAAYMPASPGHAGHETEVAWFPGGTVTPVSVTR